jgi:hypothetical protein
MSSSIEDQLEAYTFEHFNAGQAAQHIFASYGESEVARKLNEMSATQQLLENILRQEVKKNYPTFLGAMEQIQQVGQEMNELKHLIENTKKIIGVGCYRLCMWLMFSSHSNFRMCVKRRYLIHVRCVTIVYFQLFNYKKLPKKTVLNNKRD